MQQLKFMSSVFISFVCQKLPAWPWASLLCPIFPTYETAWSCFLFLCPVSIHVSFFFILCLFSTGCESFKENGGPWWHTEVHCVLFRSFCSSVFNNEWEHYSKSYFTNIYSLIQVKESRQVIGKQKKTEFFCWEVCFNTICKIQYNINILGESVPLTASEMWRAKCMKIAGKLINWSRLSNTLNIICKVVFPVCAFQENLFYQRQLGQNFILLLLLPPRDTAWEPAGVSGNPWLHVQGAWDAMCLHQIDSIRERSYFYP